jgi:hypothetical protein
MCKVAWLKSSGKKLESRFKGLFTSVTANSESDNVWNGHVLRPSLRKRSNFVQSTHEGFQAKTSKVV